jgi:hypothetical protein
MDFCVRRWVPRNPVVDVEILVAAGEVPWAAANRSHFTPALWISLQPIYR